MAVYDKDGTALSSVYGANGISLQYAYDKNGNVVFTGSGEDEFIKTTVPYTMNWLITSDWLANAETQRNAIKTIYEQSVDAIPFFLQTDGHGRYNEGNKGCHNLAEPVMRYIPNLQLGDYASYYSDGRSATNHITSSAGLSNYFPAMGNHEFMVGSDETAEEPDMAILVPAFTPSNAILGSETYGYYKVYDDAYNVKWLIGQAHMPDSNNSSGFVYGATSEQFQWFIDEMEANDGYDIIVLNHEPWPGTYYNWTNEAEYIYDRTTFDLAPIMTDRKAKRSGTYIDTSGVTHNYDFANCSSDLLCSIHGHIHRILTMEKEEYGFPVVVGRDMTNAGDCLYGIIDRAGGKLYLYPFTRTVVGNVIELDL